jgi:Fe2+ or Zn2+ uptake regulation protein
VSRISKFQVAIIEILIASRRRLRGAEIGAELERRGFWFARSRVYINLAELEDRRFVDRRVESNQLGGQLVTYSIADRELPKPPAWKVPA